MSRSIYYNIQNGYSEDSLAVVENPVYDPSFLARWLPIQMCRDWGDFDLHVMDYRQIGDSPGEHSFDPADYPEGTCCVFVRPDYDDGPDFEAMRDQAKGIFAKGPQPFPGTIIDIHSPLCFSLRVDMDTWEAVESWRRRS